MPKRFKPPSPPGNQFPTRRPTVLRPQQELFAQLIVEGTRTQADCYLKAYGRDPADKKQRKRAKEEASRKIRNPTVAWRIAELRLRQLRSIFLTREDRIKVLAANALIESLTPAERNAQSRAIEVLNKTAGDCVPDPDDPTPQPTQPGAKDRRLVITVNIFQHSPANVRMQQPQPAAGVRMPALDPQPSENGNGNGNGASNGQH